MRTNGTIVGVRDFVSTKGTPWRIISCLVDRAETESQCGKSAVEIFVGQGKEYYNNEHAALLGAECKIVDVVGKYGIAYIAGVDD